ncbi:protein with putative role during mitosis [Gonapodya sp. JEL0774]|nr:protein with putative role during mitosis [Gonapodya sp. JEL0774]
MNPSLRRNAITHSVLFVYNELLKMTPLVRYAAVELGKKQISVAGTLSEARDHLGQCPFEKIKPYIERSEKRFSELEARLAELERERRLWLESGKGTSSPEAAVLDAKAAGNGGTSSGYLNGVVTEDERESLSLSHMSAWRTVSDHRAGVTSLAYTPGVLYAGAYDGTTKVFDAESGALMRSFRGHHLSVWALAVEPGGGRLFSAGSDGTIKVWDMSGGDSDADDGWEDGVAAAVSAAGMDDVSNGQGGGCLRTLREHTGKVYSLITMEDRLYSASSDKTIKVWDLHDLSCIATLTGHTDGVNSLTPLGRDRIASAASDKTVRVWDLARSQTIYTLEDNDSEILSVAWSGSSQGNPNGMLFASTYDANIVAYAGDQGFRKIGTMQGHNWEVWQLQYTMGVLFSGSFDHTINYIASLHAKEIDPKELAAWEEPRKSVTPKTSAAIIILAMDKDVDDVVETMSVFERRASLLGSTILDRPAKDDKALEEYATGADK